MLNRLSVKQRMYIIICLVFILFLGMAWAAVYSSNHIRDMAISSTENVMLKDQKQKLQVATHTIAVAVGHAVETLKNENQRIEVIRGLIDDIRFEDDKSGYYFVYQGTTNIALPPNKKLQGSDLSDMKDKNGVYLVRELRNRAGDGGGFVTYIWPKPGAGEVPKLSYAEMIPGTDYWIGTGLYIDNIEAYKNEMKASIDKRVTSLVTTLITLAGIFFLGITAICLYIVFGITGSLKSMILSFTDIAEGDGDLTKRIEIKSNDELGELGKWFNVFLEKLQNIIRQLFGEASNVDQSSNELSAISEEMSSGAGSMSRRAESAASAAEELSTGMNSIAASMEQSSSNANAVASAAEQMNSTIREIAQNAEQARKISAEASSKTKDASEEMKRLTNAADSVGKVVETITDISQQVNLLALNASIESARAGEAGKGFAVVANEIKILAAQTAEATNDIKAQIDNIQSVSGLTAESIGGVTKIIDETREIVESIASAIEEQSAVTNEISENVVQLSAGIQEVNENVAQSSEVSQTISQDIAGVSSSSSEIAENSSQVRDRAADLKKMAEALNEIVEKFIVD
ncbi:MAG: methyl-accepting chemotaxis protein [Desulfobacteraceae bacterium]